MGLIVEGGNYTSLISEQIKSISPEVRLREVEYTLSNIDQGSFRLVQLDQKPYIAWGVVWLDNLPFCFTAHRVAFKPKAITYLEDTQVKEQSSWMVSGPKPVHEYSPPALSSERLSDAEKQKILKRLKIGSGGDFSESLSQKKREFDEFMETYSTDAIVRSRYAAAIKLACNKAEKSVDEE